MANPFSTVIYRVGSTKIMRGCTAVEVASKIIDNLLLPVVWYPNFALDLYLQILLQPCPSHD